MPMLGIACIVTTCIQNDGCETAKVMPDLFTSWVACTNACIDVYDQ
jgi:hypothetical protein